WQSVSGEVNGNAMPPQIVSQVRFTINGNMLGFRLKAEREDQMTLTIDPGKSPKQFDMTKVGSSQTNLGIYELNGDELRLCTPCADKGVRPQTIASPTNSGQSVFVLRKQKQ